jgi:hypothetical protein
LQIDEEQKIDIKIASGEILKDQNKINLGEDLSEV